MHSSKFVKFIYVVYGRKTLALSKGISLPRLQLSFPSS